MGKPPIYIFVLLGLTLTFSSCEEILFEPDITNTTIEILAPKENAVLTSSTVFFQWAAVEGATSYEVQLATPNFENARQIVFNTTVEETSYNEELPPNDYEWRVRAQNSSFSSAFTSARFKVETNEVFSSERVALISPPNNYITNKSKITLEWQEVDNAQIYRIQVLENSELKLEETTVNNSVEIDFPEGEFTWKIRAENETQNTIYTGRTILVDTTSPNTTTLLKPENNSTTSNTSLTFEWSRTPIAGSVESDSLYIFKDVALQDLEKKARVTNSYTAILNRQQTYYWYMKSFDEAGNQTQRSEVFSFTVN